MSKPHKTASRLSTIILFSVTTLLLTQCASTPALDLVQPETLSSADRAPTRTPINIANVGFQTPESVLYDARNDVYLVSNINGGGLAEDNNGFISRVSPTGQVLQLKWIAGGVNGVSLNAPKGSAISGGILYVADINNVRKFDLKTGEPLGSISLPNATFLNDVAADDGTVYVSDIGFKAAPDGIAPSGTDAIYEISRKDKVSILAQGNGLLHHPNGLAVLPNGKLQVLSFDPFDGTTEIFTINRHGNRGDVTPMPAGLLDGVVLLEHRQLLVSSWQTGSIYLVKPNGEISVVATDLPSPADIGWDSRRKRILVPIFNEDRVVLQPYN
jgi:hypothetical protein